MQARVGQTPSKFKPSLRVSESSRRVLACITPGKPLTPYNEGCTVLAWSQELLHAAGLQLARRRKVIGCQGPLLPKIDSTTT